MPRGIRYDIFNSSDASSTQDSSIRHSRPLCDALRLGLSHGQANDQAALTPEAQLQERLSRLATQALEKQPMAEMQHDTGREQQKIVAERQDMAKSYFLQTGRFLFDAFGAGRTPEKKKKRVNQVVPRNVTFKINNAKNYASSRDAVKNDQGDYQGTKLFHKNLLVISEYNNPQLRYAKTDEYLKNAYEKYKEIRKAYRNNELGSVVMGWCQEACFAFAQKQTSGPGESSGVEKREEYAEHHEKLVAINPQWMFTALNNRKFFYRANNNAELETSDNGKFAGAHHCWENMKLISNYQFHSQRGDFTLYNDAIDAYNEINAKMQNKEYSEKMIEYCKNAGFSV